MPLEVHVAHLSCFWVLVFVALCLIVCLPSFLCLPDLDMFSSWVSVCVAYSVMLLVLLGPNRVVSHGLVFSNFLGLPSMF